MVVGFGADWTPYLETGALSFVTFQTANFLPSYKFAKILVFSQIKQTFSNRTTAAEWLTRREGC